MRKINITIEDKNYSIREEIKTLRTNIQFCGDEKRVIMVTSCLPGEGKTEVSIDLARAIADMGKKVILLDLDLRKSVMRTRLQMEGEVTGASHFLSGQCPLGEAICATNIPKFHLMIAGRAVPGPTELLESQRFQNMIDSLRSVYDYIIIDCPPLGLVIDAAIIAKKCDGAILVLHSGATKFRLAQDVKEKLERTGVSILGVVLNKVEVKKNKGYYSKYYGKRYGGYGKGYGYGKGAYGEYYGVVEEGKKKKKR